MTTPVPRKHAPAPLTVSKSANVDEAAAAAAAVIGNRRRVKESGDGVTPLHAPESGARPLPGSLAALVESKKQAKQRREEQEAAPPAAPAPAKPAAPRDLVAMTAAVLSTSG